jgi:methylglutaconyl-CoA hydratase
MPEVEVVHLQVRDQIAVITLDSPMNRNALSESSRAQLLEAIRTAESTAGVRAILLTHTGGVFCSGMDLTETHRRGTPEPGLSELAEILLQLTRCPLPVVASIGGPARAGGLGLLAAADFVVASEKADFAFTEVRLGLIPAVVMLAVLRRVPKSVARELMLSGDVFGAARAHQIGLVSRLAADRPGALEAAVNEVLGSIRQGAPAALAHLKSLLNTDLSDNSEEHYARLVVESTCAVAAGEAAEGMRARLERRPPVWTGQLPQQAQTRRQPQFS